VAFWLLFAINAIIAAVFAFFLYSGAVSGAIFSTTLLVWSLIFIVMCCDLLAALAFYFEGLQRAAIALLVSFALPAAIGALLVFGVLTF
jgi:hypothetical protein